MRGSCTMPPRPIGRHRPAGRVACLVTLTLGLLLAVVAPAPAATLRLGFGDPVFDGGEGGAWLQRAQALGSGQVRISLNWASAAPSRPAAPEDPAAYDFAPTDAAVRAAAARRQAVLLLVTKAPAWAEGPGRPATATPGSWKPQAAAYGAFLGAVARRYSGTYDPGDGTGTLPRVEAFQLWNEPNLPVYLAPQWRSVAGDPRPASPGLYRALVNAAYPKIKAASPRALVVQAGTAPYGDPLDGGARMPPARFVREILCEGGSAIEPRAASRCARPIHLDVFAHHPYGVGRPSEGSYWPDDVSLGDLDRLTRAYRVAERARSVLPAGHRPFWVTEWGWESRPDPHGLSAARQAQWLAEGARQLARAGVTRALWFRIHDDPPTPSYARSVQSGLVGLDGTDKPAAAMFGLPVAVTAHRGRPSSLWALPRTSGTCRVQRRAGDRWSTVKTVACRASVPFDRTLPRSVRQVRVLAGDGTASPAVRVP